MKSPATLDFLISPATLDFLIIPATLDFLISPATVYQSIKHRLTVSVEYSRAQLSDEVTHRIAARTVSGRDHEIMTHVPRDTHVTKQRMAMRSNFPCSDLKKLGTPELSSSSSTSTALSLKNFEKRAHPISTMPQTYGQTYCISKCHKIALIMD